MGHGMRTLIAATLLLAFAFLASFSSAWADPPLRFDIKGFQVEGARLIAKERITALLAPYTGREKDFGTVQGAVEALRKAYHDMGFQTVQVVLPEQEVADGIVRITVVETPLERITVRGNRFFDSENVLRSLPDLREGQVPNTVAVSRDLKLSNENPAKRTTLQYQTGERTGEIDAVVEVADEKPWEAGITWDNTGDKQSGTARAGAFFHHANLFNRDQVLTLQYTTSPEYPKDVNIYGLGYTVPFYSLDSSFDFIAAYSDVNSGAVALGSSSLQVSGKGTVLGVRYNQNLPKWGSYEHKLILGLDYRAYQNGVDFEGVPMGNDVTVHPLSLAYAGVATFRKASAGFYFSIARNLSGGWDARDTQEDFTATRDGAPEGYTIYRYGANLTYFFDNDWRIRALVNGQYSADALVPGEQYGIGGLYSVRGFYTRQFADDKGYSATAEVHTPNLGRFIGLAKGDCRLLVFYDAGHVARNDAMPGEVSSETIASTGLGLRFTYGRHLTLSTDWGVVVTPGGSNSHGSSLVQFAASLTF